MGDIMITTAEIRRIAAEVTGTAVVDMASSAEVQRLLVQFTEQGRQEMAAHREQVRQEMATHREQVRQEMAAHRDNIRQQVDSLDQHVRTLEDSTAKKVDQLLARFDTQAARIEGALGAYTVLEQSRVAQVEAISARVTTSERRVSDMQQMVAETRGEVERLGQELHGDRDNPEAPSLYGILADIRKQVAEMNVWISNRRRIERWVLQVAIGTLRSGQFWRRVTIILGSGTVIALVIKLLRALVE